MASRDIPWPDLFLGAAVALELGGGLSVLLGWKARTGAKALMLVLVPATLTFHGFWHEPEADFREQLLQFLKNVSILGGLILVAVHGAGPWSIDSATQKSS
jgi:putative oxidoreductase